MSFDGLLVSITAPRFRSHRTTTLGGEKSQAVLPYASRWDLLFTQHIVRDGNQHAHKVGELLLGDGSIRCSKSHSRLSTHTIRRANSDQFTCARRARISSVQLTSTRCPQAGRMHRIHAAVIPSFILLSRLKIRSTACRDSPLAKYLPAAPDRFCTISPGVFPFSISRDTCTNGGLTCHIGQDQRGGHLGSSAVATSHSEDMAC